MMRRAWAVVSPSGMVTRYCSVIAGLTRTVQDLRDARPGRKRNSPAFTSVVHAIETRFQTHQARITEQTGCFEAARHADQALAA